jgi:hypothetical protein
MLRSRVSKVVLVAMGGWLVLNGLEKLQIDMLSSLLLIAGTAVAVGIGWRFSRRRVFLTTLALWLPLCGTVILLDRISDYARHDLAFLAVQYMTAGAAGVASGAFFSWLLIRTDRPLWKRMISGMLSGLLSVLSDAIIGGRIPWGLYSGFGGIGSGEFAGLMALQAALFVAGPIGLVLGATGFHSQVLGSGER